MRTFENKPTEVPDTSGSFEDYFSMARYCLNRTPQQGFDLTEMSKRLRVLNALHGSSVDLEDADYETLRSCVLSARWGVLHQDIKTFIESFQGEVH